VWRTSCSSGVQRALRRRSSDESQLEVTEVTCLTSSPGGGGGAHSELHCFGGGAFTHPGIFGLSVLRGAFPPGAEAKLLQHAHLKPSEEYIYKYIYMYIYIHIYIHVYRHVHRHFGGQVLKPKKRAPNAKIKLCQS